MSTVVSPETAKKLWTIEEFLALPDDGTERWLCHGELRPLESIMTVRNRFHSEVEAMFAHHLLTWLLDQPRPRGKIHSGEAAFRLPGDPVSLVGIDVAYASAALVAATPPDKMIYDGPPVLAVEILSPSDTHRSIIEKVDLYLAAGVVVWEVDPDLQTVRVHRPGRPSAMVNIEQELSGEPELPGFRVAVAALFEN